MLFSVLILLSTPRKSYSFAECYIFCLKSDRVLGLELGSWSCHLLHGTSEGWKHFLDHRLQPKKVKDVIHYMLQIRSNVFQWIYFMCASFPNVKFWSVYGSAIRSVLGPWSYLLHGPQEGWIMVSWPEFTTTTIFKDVIHHMLQIRNSIIQCVAFCYLPLGSHAI